MKLGPKGCIRLVRMFAEGLGVTVGVTFLLAYPVSASIGTTMASVSSSGAQGNGNSAAAKTAGRGRYVVFESNASNLVPGDTNSVSDIFLRDRVTHKTYRVSVSDGGGQANGPSHSAYVSANGRYVVFESFASNLVSGDTNGTYDVFLRDRRLAKTYRISVGPRQRQANGASADPEVSDNGRYVAFESSASNLVRRDANGAVTDVFVRDRAAGKTILVSVTPGGDAGNASSSDPAISSTGRYVAFESTATNLVPRDTNAQTDVFVRDLSARRTTRVSVNSVERQGNRGSHSADITPNGRYVAFESFSSNLSNSDTNGVSDVFVRDRVTGKTFRVSLGSAGQQGNGYSSDPSISDNGRYVAFESAARNFVRNDANARVDAFFRDRATGKTTCLSLTPGGHVGDAAASDPSLSADGAFAAFEAEASDLVSGDTNGHTDVFARGPLT